MFFLISRYLNYKVYYLRTLKIFSPLKNILVLSVVTILLVHNVFALYVEVLFAGDIQWDYFNKEKGQLDELTFTEDQSNVAYQFIFDSEFKNINANITVFEEHRNVNSEIKFNSGHMLSLTFPECIGGVSFSSILSSSCFSIPNSCKQALLSNLYSFRI
jgi:hypothetical protein